MLRKLAILATGAVVAFMLLALISGLLSRDDSRKPIEVDPSRIPEHFQKPDATGNRLPRPGEGAGGWIQRTDPKSGRIVQEIRYDKLEPLTEGEFKVTKPQSRFHLAMNRVIDIRANTGTIVAPQNIPQQGTFKDGVVVRLYETGKDQKLNLSDESPDIAAVIHLQDATFNAQLGKLDSTGDVLLEGRNAEFRGRGLVLVYNEPQQRIDYLEITQGQYLKYTPTSDDSGSKDTPPPTATAAQPAGPAMVEGRVQFYQVQFDRAVHVRSAGRSIDADDLVGYFAFNRRSNIARMHSSHKGNDSEENTLLAATDASATGMALAQVQAPANAKPDDAPQEVVMTWAGKMVVTPVAQRPDGLRTDQDLLLNFRGRPVTMRSENEDVMTCATAQYQEFNRRVAAIGSGEFPLMIQSPSLGDVTADSLSLRLSDNVGKLEGPGYIKSKAAPGNTLPAGVAAAANGAEAKPYAKIAADKGLPAGFSIRWTDHVDLLLTQAKEKPSGLKTAQFVGKVEVTDPRFTMNGDQLAVHFEPDRKGRNRRFSAVDAAGNVVAQSEDGRIVAQTLHLDTEESANGKIRPTVLVASGDVHISDKAQSISAGALTATFAEKPATGKVASGATRIDVTQLVATDHVKVKLEDGTQVQADQMDADNTTGIATLTGQPVVVGKDGAELQVAKLHLNRAKEVATAEGRGQFDFEQKFATEGNQPATGDTRPAVRRMHVTWTNGMTFDQSANLLTMQGDVVAEQSDRSEEENKLTAAAVELELMDRQLAKKQGVELKGRSVLKRLDAKGEVVLLSSRWLDTRREHLEARLRVEGPSISFDNTRELARVRGAGSMLLEDYRKRSDAEANQQSTTVQMNGRGATLFTWSRWMTMDGSSTSLVMDGNVEMTHRPIANSPVLQMQTNRLTADMKGLGGIEALSASKTHKLDIDHIKAEGGVQLRDDKRLISAQHLYYDGATQTATLEAQAGRRVNVIQLDEPKPIRAQRIIWDLRKDRLEIEQPGY